MSETYEFTEDQNSALQRLVNGMRLLAYSVYLAAAASMALITLHTARNLLEATALLPLTATILVVGTLCMVMTANLTRAGSSLQLVIDTEGDDIDHTLQGLGHFTRAFRLAELGLWVAAAATVAIILYTGAGG